MSRWKRRETLPHRCFRCGNLFSHTHIIDPENKNQSLDVPRLCKKCKRVNVSQPSLFDAIGDDNADPKNPSGPYA